MENNKTPSIRFKGFTDPWEQRKLSEVATMHARIGWQNLRTSEFLDSGDYMLITGTDFNDGAINYSTCHFVERERYEQDKHIQIKNGSILITKDGTLGKVAYIQGLSMPATLNAGVFNVEIKDETEVDNKYLFQYLKAPFLMEYVDKKATGGTIKHLNQNILVDFPLLMPSKAEQEAIGDYFERLDNLITLHQRKYNKLLNVKKSMLEKMFPKNGSNIPEIRFKGFTDPWEQRKLGEYVSITSGEAPSKFEEGTELYVKVDDLNYNDKYVVDTQNKVAEHSTVKRVTKGSVVFPKRGAAIMTNKVRILGIDSYMDTNMMALTSERLDSEFLYNIISKEGLYKIADTSTIPQINNKHIEPYEVKIPSLDEQRRIGVYFKQLDNLITLHQRELEKLQNIKKSMLEKMFV